MSSRAFVNVVLVAGAVPSILYDEGAAEVDTWLNQAMDCEFSKGTDLEPWTCGLACENAPLTNVTVLQDASLHTFGVAGRLGDECLLAFRGTKDLRNVITDLNMPNTNPWGETACPGCRVHEGWYNAYQSLADQALAALSRLACSETTLRITGHSLGGSMAAVGAFELSEHYRLSAVYTYGQPRTGNAAWVEAAKSRMHGAAFFRVVDYQDPVPHMWRGVHQSPEVYYNATRLGAYQVCEETEQKDCSYQWSIISTAIRGCQHCSYLGLNPCDCGHAEPECQAGADTLV